MNLYNKDWLSRFFRKLRISPVNLAILFSILYAITNLFCALYFNAWLPRGNTHGLSNEPSVWISDFILQPVIVGYFFWIQFAGKKVVESIMDEGILDDSEDSRQILNNTSKYLQKPFPSLLSLAIGLAGIYVFNLMFTNTALSPSPTWITIHPFIVWIRLPFLFITIYSLIMLIYDSVILIIMLNQLFKKIYIQIEPSHPDNAGGLSSIGGFSTNFGYLIGVFGIVFSVGILQNPSNFFRDYPLMLSIGFYIILAPVIFFLPLWTAHEAMLKYRERFLLEISNEFNKVLGELRNSYSKSSGEIVPLLEKLKGLEEMKRIGYQFPVWPFNLGNIKKFVSLIVTPLIPGLISILFDQIIKIIV